MYETSKIRVLIFGHKEFSQLLSSVLTDMEDHAECRIVDAIVGTIDEANKHVSLFNPDVVISAGSNASYLKKALSVPVLSIPVTESDIVSAILKASTVNKDVHVITFDDYSSLVELLNQNTSINIKHRKYETAEEAKQIYQLSKLSANNVVVGASLVCGLASQDNIKSFFNLFKRVMQSHLKRSDYNRP